MESDRHVFLTDPYARYRDKERERLGPSSPNLTPKDSHLHHGRRSIHEVRTEAVRDALWLLDAKFSRP
jgi:hypothetical protein